MKAEELMVGDWVRQKYTADVFRIAAITPPYVEDSTGEGQFKEDRIMPIPLTTDILERNGFGKEAEHKIRHKEEEGGYSIWENYGDDGSVTFVLLAMYYSEEFSDYYSAPNTEIELRYVHELQHALRQIGIEKEIQL